MAFSYPSVNPGSLRSIAQGLKLEMSGGLATDDNVFPVRLIEARLKERMSYLQHLEDRENERLGIMPNINRTVIYKCLPLIDSDDFYCKCTRTGGKLKKVELPKFLEWRGVSFISYFGNTDMDLSFTPALSIAHMNSLELVINRPKYFLAGQNAYVSLPADYALMCEVTVTGIPEDATATSGPCFDPWSTDWKVPEHLKAIAIDQVRSTFVPTIVQTEQVMDVRNNANTDNDFITTQTP